jgi:hypothetical protein
MQSPAWKRFERLAFCALTVASFFVGYQIAGRPAIDAAGRTKRANKDAERAPVAAAAPATANVRVTEHAVDAAATVPGNPDRATIYQQMITALNEPISTERWMMLAGVLQGLSSDNWRSALEALDDERKLYGKEHSDARAFLVRRAGEVVGSDAIKYFLEKKDRDAVNSALTGWASKRPTEALAWLSKQTNESERAQFAGAAIRGLAMTEPDLAISFLEQAPAADRRKYTANLVPTIVRTAGIDQTQQLVDGMLATAKSGGRLEERYVTDVFRDFAEIKVRRAYVSGNVETAIAWLDQHVGQPYVNYETVRNSAEQLAKYDPFKALAWVGTVNARAVFPPSISPVGYGTILNAWTGTVGLEPVAQWLNNNANHVAYDRLAVHYSELAMQRNPDLASQVAAGIKDPTTRTATVGKVQQAIDARARRKK